MKKLGKVLALILVICLTMALFTACSAGGNNKKLTLTALMWMPDNPDIPLTMADEFTKANPNITIETSMMTDSIEQMLQPKAASGEMPDFMSYGSGSFGELLADQGHVLDLGKTEAWTNMLDALKPEWTSPNGVKFGISGGLCTTLIYYNKDMFADAGITTFPDNYEDFLAACQKLKDKGYVPMAYSGGDPNTLINSQWSYGLAQYVLKGDTAMVTKIKNGEYNFDNADMAKVFQRIIDLPEMGYCVEGWQSLDYTNSLTTFTSGQAAMCFNGTWVAGIATDVDFTLGCALPPWADKGETPIPVLSSETGFAVGATGDTDKEAAALKLLDYWNGEGFHLYQNPRMLVPHIKSDKIIGEVKLAPQIIELMDYCATFPKASPLHFVYMPSAIDSMKIIQQAQMGEISPEEAAKLCQEAVK